MTSAMPEPLLGRARWGTGPDTTRSSVECAAPHRIRGTTGRPPVWGRSPGRGAGTAEPTLPTPGAGQDSILVAIAAVAGPRIRRAPSPTASPIEEPISAPAMTSPG